MRPPSQRRVGFLLRVSSLSIFALLVLAAIVLNSLQWEAVSPLVRRSLRELGYAALVLMLASYAYWPRQWFLNRRAGKIVGWLGVHIGASYAALTLTLLHSLGRAGTALTFWMMVLFWAVIVSGVAGYFGQKVCYRFLSLMISRELGMERLLAERSSLQERMAELTRNDQPQENSAYARLLSDARQYLMSEWPSWTWLFTVRVYQPVSENLYQQAYKLAGKEEYEALEQFWPLVDQRRQIDVEYWFHRLAACWLHVHRAAAALLAALVAAHVVSSIVYGGW